MTRTTEKITEIKVDYLKRSVKLIKPPKSIKVITEKT